MMRVEWGSGILRRPKAEVAAVVMDHIEAELEARS